MPANPADCCQVESVTWPFEIQRCCQLFRLNPLAMPGQAGPGKSADYAHLSVHFRRQKRKLNIYIYGMYMPLFAVSHLVALTPTVARLIRHMSLPFAWGKLVCPQLLQHHRHIYRGTRPPADSIRRLSLGLFELGQRARACSCHLEMYIRYNRKYESVYEYVVKLNSINNIVIWICEMNSLGTRGNLRQTRLQSHVPGVSRWRGFKEITKSSKLSQLQKDKYF